LNQPGQNTAGQGSYIRADELDAAQPVQRKGWLWPWGVAGLLAFLVLTGFFMVLLQPAEQPVPLPTNRATTEPLAPPPAEGAPKAKEPPLPASADAPQPDSQVLPPMVPEGQQTTMARIVPESAAARTVLPLVGKQPRIALFVIDLADPAITRSAIELLPASVDLGFLPGSDKSLSTLADKDGHAVWMGLPMQPRRYPAINPGRDTLLVGAGAAQNPARLERLAAQMPQAATGFYNIMGSAFTADKQALGAVIDFAKARGLAFFDTRSGPDTVAASQARKAGVPAALNMAYLDETPAALAAKLDQLAVRARQDGVAIGVIGPSAASVKSVSDWLKTAPSDVTLVSVRAIAATADLQPLP
jgi:uncharacterized protein